MQAVKTQNIDWINNLRLIALLAVIILHSTSLLLMQFGKVPLSTWLVADFLNAMVRFAVPCFVMITGALLLPKEYELAAFFKKRLTRVVIPFLFWSLIYVIYSWYNEELLFTNNLWLNIKLVLHQLKNGSCYHLWYVYMLIGLYFIIPVIGKFVRNASEKETLYFLLVWFGVMMLNQPFLSPYNPSVDMRYFTGYIGYLVLGNYLATKDFNMPNLRNWMVILFLVSLFIITLGSWLITKYPKIPGTMFYEPINPVVLLLSVSVFLIVKYTIPKVPILFIKIRDFIGGYNYGIYLGHALVLFFLDDLAGISYKLCNPILSIPITAVICLFITLILVWLISKVPFGKWVAG